MSSPQVSGPYLAFAVFLIVAFIAVGREFWMAQGLDKAYPLGRVAIAVPLAVFGAEHFVSAQAIMQMVPVWMPGRLFWTYFVGEALFAAALSFIFRVGIRLAAALLGLMFFCFVVMMDVPAAIASPQSRFAWTLAARELAFSAGGILLAVKAGARQTRIATAALYLVALITMFYGIENLLHPECVPVVPLAKVTPFAHFWTTLTGIIMVVGSVAMFVRNISQRAAAALGAVVVLIVMTFYLAIMISKPDIESLNYFTDTLMFGGVLLISGVRNR